MSGLLRDRTWKPRYSGSGSELVRAFWIPALSCAVRYDRTTGYFTAPALTVAARGLEHLVRHRGRMRLLVGCTLGEEEVRAILQGEDLRATVGRYLGRNPLLAGRPEEADALELLAWMVAEGFLDVRIAVPCDGRRRPVADAGIFHQKSGVFEDRTGDRIAFVGSINETREGWLSNFESFHVFTSWEERDHLEEVERDFEQLWENRHARALVVDVPEAVRRDLLRFLPEDGRPPRRLREAEEVSVPASGCEERAAPYVHDETRAKVWAYIAHAPHLPGGEWVGEATSAVRAWPHQAHAFLHMWRRWPPRRLIADEVGLGKTVQAGLLLRQAWLSGRAKRMLVIAPAAVLPQWQVELREKFNLLWPIYDGRRLVWPDAPGLRPEERVRDVAPDAWHREPFVLVSAQLIRRRERARELIERAEPWDLVVVDEAHHARRRGADPDRNEPNRLLSLLRALRKKTAGLVLLTATPMQLHPVEVWDLLDLLGLPPEWSAQNFLRFFEYVARPETMDAEAMEFMAELFRAVEAWDGPAAQELVERVIEARELRVSQLQRRHLLTALRDPARTPRRRLVGDARRAAVLVMAANSPVARRIGRNTRELLRRYRREGRLRETVPERVVRDEWVAMRPEERELYEAVEEYVANAWRAATPERRNAVGFVMTIYRRRLASSVRALQCTLEDGLARIAGEEAELLEEDLGREVDPEEIGDGLERSAIEQLLALCARVGTESKAEHLLSVLDRLAREGRLPVLVFTQYTDTMDGLRTLLERRTDYRVVCWSGRGGEVREAGSWRACSRDEVKRRLVQGEADVLVCTDAAAEGLNLQFAGGLVNWDMPWNPMRVEQRIGRIDRIGQRHETIVVVNLHLAGTVEADVYRALRARIRLFEGVVGPLQPILARVPRRIEEVAARGEAPAAAVAEIERELERRRDAFDPLALAAGGIMEEPRAVPPLSLDDLACLLNRPDLLPDGVEVARIHESDVLWRDPDHPEGVRVTANARFFELHAGSCELFSPGSPLFPRPPVDVAPPDRVDFRRLLAGQ